MDEQSNDTNRRRFHRVLFDARVTLRDKDNFWQTRLVDISLNGVLAFKPENWHAHADKQPLQVVIHLAEGLRMSMDAHVAHVENETIGLQVDEIDLESVSHLRRLVEMNSQDPELINRELRALGQLDQAS